MTNFTQLSDKWYFDLEISNSPKLENAVVNQPCEFKGLLYYVISIAELKGGLVAGALSFAALLLCIVGCQQGGQAGSARALHRGQPGEPRTLDPQLADDDFSFAVIRELYEGLTSEDAHGQVIPGIADYWTIDELKTTYTFHIRTNAKWSNGDPVLAEEFVLGLRRAVDPKTASGSAGLLAIIKGASEVIANKKGVDSLGVAAIGRSDVRIQLEHPAPYFLQLLSQPIAAPFHIPLHKSESAELFDGAYVLVKRVPGAIIELSANPYYWGAPNVHIKAVLFVNAESEQTEFAEFRAGQIDLTYTIPLSELERAKQNYPKELQTTQSLGVAYLALNLTNSPLGPSVQLRQALSIAIDRELMTRHLLEGVEPAYSFIPKAIRDYVPAEYEWRSWSREKQLELARRLYSEAGYSTAKPVRLRLYYSNNETIQRTMVAIASSWKENLGVQSELMQEEFRSFLAGRKDRSRWDIARLRWEADFDDPSNFLEIFSKEGTQNDPGYSNPLFDQLLSAARVEADIAKRAGIYRQAEKTLLNDYAVIPIYFPLARRLVGRDVGGAELHPMNRTYSKNLFWRSEVTKNHQD